MKSTGKAELYKVLGDIFKKSRLRNNLTQEKMAEKLGISVKYISRIENGNGGVKIETLIRYMNALGISPNVVFEKLIVNPNLLIQISLSKKLSKLPPEKIAFVSSILDLLRYL